MPATNLVSASHVCNTFPIAWATADYNTVDRVAELMGPKFSNGAIVQHLAKLRAKMVEADLEDVPIPPPLKKGMTTKEPSKIYAPGNKRKKPTAAAGAVGAAAARAPATPPARKTTKAKGKKIKKEASDDESEEEPDFYDSDEEWGVSKKKAKKAKKSPVKKERLSDSEVSPKTVKADSEGEDVKDGEKEDSPGMSTRGRRLNYAQMENGAGEEEVDGEEDGDVEYEEAQDDVVTTPAQVPPEDDGFNGLPTPEGQVETAVAPFTLVRPTALAAPPPIQNLRYSYDTPSAPAQRRYPAAPSNGLDFISGGGSQHVSSPMSCTITLADIFPVPYSLQLQQLQQPARLSLQPCHLRRSELVLRRQPLRHANSDSSNNRQPQPTWLNVSSSDSRQTSEHGYGGQLRYPSLHSQQQHCHA